jgi:hypothetical protein
MPLNLISDARKSAFPDAMPKPGGTLQFSVDAITGATHSPGQDGVEPRHYYIRTSATIRFAVHNADYVFTDGSGDAVLDVSEVRMIKLADAGGRWITLSMMAVAAAAQVTLEEVL